MTKIESFIPPVYTTVNHVRTIPSKSLLMSLGGMLAFASTAKAMEPSNDYATYLPNVTKAWFPVAIAVAAVAITALCFRCCKKQRQPKQPSITLPPEQPILSTTLPPSPPPQAQPVLSATIPTQSPPPEKPILSTTIPTQSPPPEKPILSTTLPSFSPPPELPKASTAPKPPAPPVRSITPPPTPKLLAPLPTQPSSPQEQPKPLITPETQLEVDAQPSLTKDNLIRFYVLVMEKYRIRSNSMLRTMMFNDYTPVELMALIAYIIQKKDKTIVDQVKGLSESREHKDIFLQLRNASVGNLETVNAFLDAAINTFDPENESYKFFNKIDFVEKLGATVFIKSKKDRERDPQGYLFIVIAALTVLLAKLANLNFKDKNMEIINLPKDDVGIKAKYFVPFLNTYRAKDSSTDRAKDSSTERKKDSYAGTNALTNIV